jgi:hypothetical protein
MPALLGQTRGQTRRAEGGLIHVRVVVRKVVERIVPIHVMIAVRQVGRPIHAHHVRGIGATTGAVRSAVLPAVHVTVVQAVPHREIVEVLQVRAVRMVATVARMSVMTVMIVHSGPSVSASLIFPMRSRQTSLISPLR